MYFHQTGIINTIGNADVYSGILLQQGSPLPVAIKKLPASNNESGESVYLDLVQPQFTSHPNLLKSYQLVSSSKIEEASSDSSIDLHSIFKKPSQNSKADDLLNYKGENYFISELMQYDLFSYIYKNTFSIEDKYYLAIQVFKQMTSALQLIHATGYVHLDVKPANIFIHPNGRFVLGDFGNITSISPGKKVQSGTPLYYKDSLALPLRDFYSLGMVLLDILFETDEFLIKNRIYPRALAYESNYSLIKRIYYRQIVQPLTKQAPHLVTEARWFYNQILSGMILNENALQKEFFNSRTDIDTGDLASKTQQFFQFSQYKPLQTCKYFFLN